MGVAVRIFRAPVTTTTPGTASSITGRKKFLVLEAGGMVNHGVVLALVGKAADAVQVITSTLTAGRSMGQTLLRPFFLSSLARAHAELGLFDDAWRCAAALERVKQECIRRGVVDGLAAYPTGRLKRRKSRRLPRAA
jgi:hypothetical protein